MNKRAATRGELASTKDAADVQAHIDKLKAGMKGVGKATEALKNAVGQKARDAAKEVLRRVTKDVKDLALKPKPKTTA